MSDLGERQAQLVRSLVAGGPVPPGFDSSRTDAAAQALLRKRCAEVRGHWPSVLADVADRDRFRVWAAARPKVSSFADGYAFALEHRDALGPAAIAELEIVRARWRLRGNGTVTARRVRSRLQRVSRR